MKAVPITSQPYRPQPHHLLEGVVVSRAGPSEAWLRREKGGGDGRRAGEQRGPDGPPDFCSNCWRFATRLGGRRSSPRFRASWTPKFLGRKGDGRGSSEACVHRRSGAGRGNRRLAPKEVGNRDHPHLYPPLTRASGQDRSLLRALGGGAAWARDEGKKVGANHCHWGQRRF